MQRVVPACWFEPGWKHRTSHLLLYNGKTALLLGWKHLTETFSNLCSLWDEKISLSIYRDHLLCFSGVNWSQSEKCAACLFIYFAFLYKCIYMYWLALLCRMRAAACRGNNIFIDNSVCVCVYVSQNCKGWLQLILKSIFESRSPSWASHFYCFCTSEVLWNFLARSPSGSLNDQERGCLCKQRIKLEVHLQKSQEGQDHSWHWYWLLQSIFHVHPSHPTETYFPIFFPSKRRKTKHLQKEGVTQ